jgi:dihydrofolate synthase/folylpolyglutamate synthase
MGQFINLEQGVKPPCMRPERMQIIAKAAGNPEHSIPAIHVAGSKGKGSVTAMASAMLRDAGYRVARYMSPHLSDYRERITLGNVFFEDDEYREAGKELYWTTNIVRNPTNMAFQQLRKLAEGARPDPTFFELLTLYYFLCARTAHCDALVVETGMGGRLDPTNIAESEAVVITSIELEHTEMLGDTIEKIAFEKAGVIKPGKPVLVAEQAHEEGAKALAVFRETAARLGSPFYYAPDIFTIKNLSVTEAGTSWTIVCANKDFFEGEIDFSIPVPGAVQAANASLAAFAVRAAFPKVSLPVMRRALSKLELPARFERVRADPPFIVDGAHTAMSVKFCAETWKSLYGTGGLLLFGCAEDKDVDAMADILAPLFSIIIITAPGFFKTSKPQKAYESFLRASLACAPAEGENAEAPRVFLMEDTSDAVRKAKSYTKETSLPGLTTGSFYLAAEIRKFFSWHAED